MATPLGIVHLLDELRLVVKVEYGDAVLTEEIDEVFLVHPRNLRAVAQRHTLGRVKVQRGGSPREVESVSAAHFVVVEDLVRNLEDYLAHVGE